MIGFTGGAFADTTNPSTLSDTVMGVINTVSNMAYQNGYYNPYQNSYYNPYQNSYYNPYQNTYNYSYPVNNTNLADIRNDYLAEQNLDQQRLLQLEHKRLITERQKAKRLQQYLKHCNKNKNYMSYRY
jgi:hypothetical protein